LTHRHIAIEGPAGVGKTALAERLATRLDAALVVDESANPFDGDARSGRSGAAFQAQLFRLLTRHRQQSTLKQADLFAQATVSDYLFDKDKIYAYQTLDDNELFIYQRLFELLSADIAAPDLVIYLQAQPAVLAERVRRRAVRYEREISEDYLTRLAEGYSRFFYHYDAAPLLIVNSENLNFVERDPDFELLVSRVRAMRSRREFFNLG